MLRTAFLLLIFLAACQPALPTPPLPTLASIQILDFWEPVSGTLASAEDVQEWRFVGQAGDAIRLRAIGEQADVTLTLQTADGLTLTQGDSLEVTLPASGTYTVLVQGGAGGYQLGLGYTDRPNPNERIPTPIPEVVGVPTPTPPYSNLGTYIGSLEAGQTLGATFSQPDERHVYIFNGQAGEYVTIQMGRVSGTVDPILTLYTPQGNAMATDDNSGGNRAAAIRNITLPEDGVYSIAAEGDGLPGSYWISLAVGEILLPVTPTVKIPTATPHMETLTPPIPTAVMGNRLEDHVVVAQEVLEPGEFDRFPIFAAAGEFLTIGVSPRGLSQFEPYVEIYGPTGELVASASSQDGIAIRDALIPMMPVPLTGVYVVFVKGLNDTSTGDYLISYGVGPSRENVLRGLTEPDTVYNGDIAKRGLRDVWSLYLNAGDIITVAVSPTSNTLDPFVELVGPDGSLAAMDDNGGGGRSALISSAHAPVSGLYRLRVTPVNAASFGPYTLVWRYVNVAPTPTLPPATIPILDYDDFVPENTYLFYPFQGRAGQQVLVRVFAQPGSSLDPVAAVLGPDGTIIAEQDDREGNLNPRFYVTLPEDGTYTVRVNGYLSSGPFQLLVDLLVAGSPDE
jgi:hypothetical protein